MVMAEYVTRNRTPVRVGFYDIIRTIGRGNFAVVKLARHRVTKTEVAIKIIDKSRLDQLNLKKIYREIQVLKLLNHQHIVKLYQVMETSSKIYLVCEYARNGELFDYITEQGRLPEDKAKRMFWQVLTAVEYCHKNNVVHRDLKAENLLLDSNNNVKLADFGFSNFYQSGNKLSTWCGSPPYAAPEVFEGKLYDGPHLDVWSMGVVLYVLVCGTFPFDGSNLATLKERVLSGRFRIPYWMSQDCENLVRRMLVINPKKRLTITQIKKHNWMQECVTAPVLRPANSPKIPRRGKLSEYNEHVLKIMQGLRINRQKILESLSFSAYDHLYAIYHLLVDRLKLHRTSFPLEGSITFDGGRRRPSNVADQALASMFETSHQQPDAGLPGQMHNHIPGTSSDVSFQDVIAGLPQVPNCLTTPVRYASPPLPQIRTSIYEDNSESTASVYPAALNDDNATYDRKQHLLSVDYKQKSVDSEKPNLGNYNLYKRRHTLMVPNPSQIQMLRAGLNSADQHSFDGNTPADDSSQEQISQNPNSCRGFENAPCGSRLCSDQMCDCEQANPIGNLLMPCKNLPNSSELMNFNQQNAPVKSQMRRRSGVPAPLARGQFCPGHNTKNEMDATDAKVAYIISQRQQLDSSPIGFRQGRRASDGLLLLGDNMLKEHLQRLSQGTAVPETTLEDGEAPMSFDQATRGNHYLQIPKQNPVNRTNSDERNLIPQPNSPTATPIGSGSNISYQPYNNSLARRRSLHNQHLQRNPVSGGSPLHYDSLESAVSPNTTPPPTANIPSQMPQEPQTYTNESNFQWSSWKPVQENTPSEGNANPTHSMWQQLAMMKSNSRNDGDVSPLTVASDESVATKAAASQEQREQKPVRQQSLPITPSTLNHSFGASQNPSMAQMLQQRRLQRRLKVAASNMIPIPGYQLPLPEMEHLKIDTGGVLGHSPTNGVFSRQHNDHDWTDQSWRMQYNTLGVPASNVSYKTLSDYGGFQDANHVQGSNPISNQTFSWSYDFPSQFKKSTEFDAATLLVAESISNSAERLDHSGTESMEFAMY